MLGLSSLIAVFCGCSGFLCLSVYFCLSVSHTDPPHCTLLLVIHFSAKQPSALLALDQDEVKRRLAEKATALVLEQPDISAFCDADIPFFPKSKLSAKYCLKRKKVGTFLLM